MRSLRCCRRCPIAAMWSPGIRACPSTQSSWRRGGRPGRSMPARRRAGEWCCGTTRAIRRRRMARPGHHHDLDAGARCRCPAVPGNRSVHARALARTVRDRAARRAADGPLLAAAAHVPCAVSGGRCNRNHCARGAGLRDATGDGLGDCVTARRNRPRRHARVRTTRRRQKVALAEDLGDDHRRAAALGRAGRRLVEERHDLSRSADAVTRALGWVGEVGRVTAHLGDLPTPPLSRPITHAEARVAELSRRVSAA